MANAHDLLVAQRAAMMGGWKNPYVTDGLIAMWDGEWNAGGGVHDPKATVWKDLVDGRGLQLVSGMSFEDKYFKVVGLSSYNIQATIADSWNDGMPFTLRIVARCPNGYSFNDKGHNVVTLGGNIQIGRGASTFCYMGISKYPYATAYNITSVSYDDTLEANFYAYVRSASDFNAYKRTALSAKSQFYRSSLSSQSINPIFILFNDGKNAEYNLYSAAVWNRELTHDELESVYAIDKARFNLPDVA